jgi:hypothetical protein
MRPMERDDVERGPRGCGEGCCGGSGCCGGHGHGPHSGHQDATTGQQMALEERQLDLEQDPADLTAQLRNLRTERA